MTKWIASVGATVVAGVLVYWLTIGFQRQEPKTYTLIPEKETALKHLDEYISQKAEIEYKKSETDSKIRLIKSEMKDLKRKNESLRKQLSITQANIENTLEEIRKVKKRRNEPYREELDMQLEILETYEKILSDKINQRRPIIERLKKLKREFDYHNDIQREYQYRLKELEGKILAEKKTIEKYKN